jgi:WD40 repeat protein
MRSIGYRLGVLVLVAFTSLAAAQQQPRVELFLQTGHSQLISRVALIANGKKLHTFQGHTNFVWNVALSRDGKEPWTVFLDGTVRLWDPATGKERCRLYSFDAGKDWLAVTPEGLFDGSEGAARFAAYRVPGTQQFVDDDATRRRFYRPGLLAQLWLKP